MTIDLGAFVQGAALGFGLIIAIGAQNAFVIRQGVRGEYAFAVATVCCLTDAALITAGAFGLGSLIAETPWLRQVAAWGGAAFLLVYGSRSAWSAYRPAEYDWDAGPKAGALRSAIGIALALSWLNPHVYLDTVVMLGGIAAQVSDAARPSFTIGAVIASFVWFYGLVFGAKAAAPFFRSTRGAQVLDGLVAIVMFAIAFTLMFGELKRMEWL